MRIFSRSFKIVGTITLLFFTWSYLPLFQFVAYAASQDKKARNAQPQRPGKEQPAEKLDKLLDDLKADTSKAEEKAAKGADTSSEVESIKSRKAEIEALDADLKKDFAFTEKKLRDANLPKEILDRHNKFVKNYEDNLAELKANIDAVEKAKTPSALTAELTKTKKHLDKVKPAKKSKPFDPNKLPNRIVKAKKRQPRMKKEEWEKELPKKELKKKARAAQRQQLKPVLVASNGSLAGLLSGAGYAPDPNPSENYLQLAAATDGLLQTAQTGSYGKYPYPVEIYPLPWQTDMTDEDNQETLETHITDAIRAKAVELGNHPVKMFNWLYNNIQLVPSYGSIQGADMCLQTKQCNETDIASLTIAMFRAAGWPARYEFVTAELDISRFMENMGGFTDPQAAITFAATGGIPVRPVISGGKITSVQFERVYATALLPEGFYIGAAMAKGWSRPMWMPIDVSMKHYVATPGIDLNAAVPFDAQSFVNQVQSTATVNEAEGYVTNINAALIQQTMHDYQARVQDYISQNTPTATVGDIIGKQEIKQVNYPHLSPTGWTKPIAGRVQSHALPDSMKSSISFNIPDPSGATNGLAYTTSLPELAGKKITLSFSPATTTDQAVIESYLPKPHADGTPIQPSELPSSLPAYLIKLKPELRIDGQVVAIGSPVTMGSALSFTISLNEPGIGTSNIDNVIQAGEYYGVGLDTGRIGDSTLNSIGNKLASTKAKLDAKDFSGLTEDDLIGDLLYNAITSYFADLDAADDISAATMGVAHYRAPSIGMFSLVVKAQSIFNVPVNVSSQGMMMDVDRLMQAVYAKDGNQNNVKQYMLMSGNNSSVAEHAVPEYLFSTPNKTVQGISAAKALQIANTQGIPIYTITQSNINTTLPFLQVDTTVKTDIQNAVNAGKAVTISKTNIAYNGWTGCGYIVIDPSTGAGAYMINSGANGGMILQAASSIISHFLITEAEAAELGDTYITQMPTPVIQPPCNAYFHATEFAGCVLTAISSTAFLKGVLAVLGAVAGGFVWAQFFGAPVLYIVGVLAILVVLAVLGSIMLECRKTATHCDPGH